MTAQRIPQSVFPATEGSHSQRSLQLSNTKFFTFVEQFQTMNIKKLELDFEDTGYYALLGIITALPDYMLAHRINQTVNIRLQRFDDFIYGSNHKKLPYPWYYSFYDEFKTGIHLLSNNHPEKKLIPKLKNIDYLIFITNISDNEIETVFTKKAREIAGITGIYKLDLQSIPQSDLFLEQLEMHEINTLKK